MQKLNFSRALSFVIGNIIGVGIFTTTGYAAKFIHSPKIMLLAWVFGGLYALSGAFVYGKLAAEFPVSGGDYRYLSEKVHPLAGYIFGWSALLVTYSGSIAALAIGAAWYLNGFAGIPDFTQSLISVGFINISKMQITGLALIAIFTMINYRGLQLTARYQWFLASGMLVLIIAMIFGGLLSPAAQYGQLLITGGQTEISGFITALIAVLFTFMGWTSVVYIADEIDYPARHIPKILLIGVAIVSVLYFGINLVYLIALPLADMPNVIDVARGSGTVLWGAGAARFISLLIFISVLSTINSTILSGSRIYMVMGKDGYAGGFTAAMHKKFNTPARAIIIQSVWAGVLLISGTFNQILSFVVFVMLLFSITAGILAMTITYSKNKELLHIGISGFYVLFCGIILVNTAIEQTMQALWGIVLIAPSVLFYYLDRRSNFT